MRAVGAPRNQARDRERTPVPLSPRHFSSGLTGALMPSGTEAQLKAIGSNGTLFAVIEALATAEASPKWHMYHQLPDDVPEGTERKKAPDHPALWLWNNPNKFYSRPRLVKTVAQHKNAVGEGIIVVQKFGTLPVSLWPVRPDRMAPVPHPEKFLAGWVYTGPDGEQVPLGHDQVIQIVQNPCPWDHLRGMGAVQTILSDIYGADAAARWHSAFFRNSAIPGGIIEVPEDWSDVEFERFNERWRTAHQGLNNAGRVAVLEHGAMWKQMQPHARDMQFAEMWEVFHDAIRGAFRMSNTMLGRGESEANRATAEAQEYMFEAWQAVPRLDGWRDEALNFRLLPMFSGEGYEFDYVSPVRASEEVKNATRTSKATAYKTYVDAGVDPNDEAMLREVGVPRMRVTARPAPAPVPQRGEPAPAAHLPNGHGHPPRLAFGRAPARPALPRAAVDDEEGEPDLAGILADLEKALTRLQGDWGPLDEAWVAALAEQVRAAAEADDRSALEDMSLDTARAAELLAAALDAMEATAARRAAREVAEQGVDVTPPEPGEEENLSLAEVAAALVAGWLVASAAEKALLLWGLGAAAVVAAVVAFLRSLTHSRRWSFLGGLLHGATNRGRHVVFTIAVGRRPGAVIRASEVNDRNTCPPCRQVDGHVFASLAEARSEYPGGGYWACYGREKCRGTFYLTWPD